jgi:hypothetical protein
LDAFKVLVDCGLNGCGAGRTSEFASERYTHQVSDFCRGEFRFRKKIAQFRECALQEEIKVCSLGGDGLTDLWCHISTWNNTSPQ